MKSLSQRCQINIVTSDYVMTKPEGLTWMQMRHAQQDPMIWSYMMHKLPWNGTLVPWDHTVQNQDIIHSILVLIKPEVMMRYIEDRMFFNSDFAEKEKSCGGNMLKIKNIYTRRWPGDECTIYWQLLVPSIKFCSLLSWAKDWCQWPPIFSQ